MKNFLGLLTLAITPRLHKSVNFYPGWWVRRFLKFFTCSWVK